MKIAWDKEAEAVYIYLTRKKDKSDNTEEVANGIYVDFKEGKPIGIEVVGVVGGFNLKELKIEVK